MEDYINKQFTLTSDGTTDGTKLIGPDGNVVGMCDRIVWEANGPEVCTKMTITLLDVPINVTVPESQVTIEHKDLESLLQRAEDFTIYNDPFTSRYCTSS